MCCFDCHINNGVDALERVLNIYSAVSSLGFFGQRKEIMYPLLHYMHQNVDLLSVWMVGLQHSYDTIQDDSNSNGLATFIKLTACTMAKRTTFRTYGQPDGEENSLIIVKDGLTSARANMRLFSSCYVRLSLSNF